VGIEGHLSQGFVTAKLDEVINWTRTVAVADDLRPRPLRGGDDARRAARYDLTASAWCSGRARASPM
jgi:hypothetical protein